MTEDQRTPWLRLILFMCAMFLITLSAALIDILIFVLMFTITWVFVRWEGGDSITELGLDVDSRFGPHISIGVIAAAIATLLVAAIAFFFGGQLRPINEITSNLVVNVILNAALFSFFEELTHRGYILPRMENLIGRGAAIIFSSLFFSLLHFDWWEPAGFNILLIFLFTINLVLGGTVLSLGYYWSGQRLWVPIAFHFMWNVVAYIMFPSFPQEAVIRPEIFQIEWGVTTIIGFLLGLSILWSLLATQKNKE
jgi:membrane protease YdiL (CAAX protease family)